MGSALALSFSRSGFHVFATARTLSKIQHFTSVANATLLPLDVTSSESIAVCVAAVKEKTGGKGLDVLVNNSGRGYAGPLLDADLEEGKRMFEVNFWGLLAVTQGFADLLVRTKGTVVNISSISASVYSPYRGESTETLPSFLSHLASLEGWHMDGITMDNLRSIEQETDTRCNHTQP